MTDVTRSPGALDGLRVLDVSTHVAGPYCAKLLATCGADVIKIEPPGGDPMRRCGPLDPSGVSFAYLDLNVGKRGMELDLRSKREQFLELVAGADAVIESGRPGALDRLGLGYDVLRGTNPRMVLTSITSFGQTGPYRDVDATEIVLYAMGGEMYANGQPDAEPLMLAPRVALGYAGQTAAVATTAAVLDGRGDWVDVSVLEPLLVSVDRRGQSLVAYAYCGEKKERDGDPSSGPPAYLRCADGWLHMTTNPSVWPTLATMIGLEEETPQDELRERWIEWAAARPKLEVVEALQEAALPAAPVNSVADLATDPHLSSRDFFEDVGGRRHVGVFARFSDTPARLARPAPQLGEHDGATWLQRARPLLPQRGELPLEGVRVIDLGVVLAGPYAAMALGDLGAEVIRVESTRRFPPSTRGFLARPSPELAKSLGPLGGGYPDRDPGERPWNRYPLFNLTGRNKLGVTVDLRDENGRDAFLRLVATADVLVTNQTPGTLEKLGLGWETCCELNDQLIYIEATSLGVTGPFRLWRGYGMEMEAIAGHDLLRHYPDRGVDSNSWTVTADAAGSLAISLAAQAALYARRWTGRGQYVDLSMVENFLGLIGPAFLEYTTTGHVPEPLGNRDFNVVQGCYPCAGDDRWLVMTIRDDDDWAGVLRASGLAPDDRFTTNESRRAHHDELDDLLASWTSPLSREEAVERLRAAGVPTGPVLDDADAFADPHLADRGSFWEMTQADCGTYRYPGAPYRFTNAEISPRLPPVMLGEHNDHVWRQLVGLDDEDYERLVADGQISMEFAPEIR